MYVAKLQRKDTPVATFSSIGKLQSVYKGIIMFLHCYSVAVSLPVCIDHSKAWLIEDML